MSVPRRSSDLGSELLDFPPEGVPFRELDLQESKRDTHLLFDSFGREVVRVRGLSSAVREISDLHPAALDQGPNAVVHFSDADAEVRSDVALRCLRVLRDVGEELVAELIGKVVIHGFVQSLNTCIQPHRLHERQEGRHPSGPAPTFTTGSDRSGRECIPMES